MNPPTPKGIASFLTPWWVANVHLWCLHLELRWGHVTCSSQWRWVVVTCVPTGKKLEEPVHGAPGSVSLSPAVGQHGGELEPQQFCRMNDKLIRIVVSHCVWGSFITATWPSLPWLRASVRICHCWSDMSMGWWTCTPARTPWGAPGWLRAWYFS